MMGKKTKTNYLNCEIIKSRNILYLTQQFFAIDFVYVKADQSRNGNKYNAHHQNDFES